MAAGEALLRTDLGILLKFGLTVISLAAGSFQISKSNPSGCDFDFSKETVMLISILPSEMLSIVSRDVSRAARFLGGDWPGIELIIRRRQGYVLA